MSAGRPNFGRMAAMIRKEALQIARDPSTYLIAFALPLLLLFLFGYALNLDATVTRIGLVVQDDSAEARSLASAYANNRYFDVTPARTVAEVEHRLTTGELRGLIVIPQDFGSGAAAGSPPPVQIVTDASQPNNAAFAAAYAQGVLASWAAGEAREAGDGAGPRIAVDGRFWFNPELVSRYSLVLGSVAIVMSMIGTLLTSLVIAREWERGTMEAMMATPMHMIEFLVSKTIPYFILGLFSMTLCSLLAVFVFGVPLQGSFAALLLIASAFLLPALGLGLLISGATKNQFVASQLALITGFLPTFLLSGFLYEISSMPWPIQAVTYLIPARYLIPCLTTVFLTGDVWPLFIPNILAMLAFGVAFLAFTLKLNRRTLDT
ncbi:MAG TPA: ABC transporter permease [Allosphingosinicella sp.]|jgi:ABC-2 type transport system permease protein